MPLANVTLPASGDVVVVVGPEGGISPDELAEFEASGAVAVRLGSTVLRSSSAGPAALAVLSAMARWR
jgi:16S rRNA (uracil1498-N3)-methyltransferase